MKKSLYFVLFITTATALNCMERFQQLNLQEVLPVPQLTPRTWAETLESWKKTLKGESQFNETLQQILRGPDSADSTPMDTKEHNINRLLRFLVENNELYILDIVIEKLALQRESRQPGHQAKQKVQEQIKKVLTDLEHERAQKAQFLEQELRRIQQTNDEFKQHHTNALYYLTKMQKNIERITIGNIQESDQKPPIATFQSVIENFNALQPKK